MINVGGFLFEDEATAARARKEEEGIRFIKDKTSLNNPQVVYKLYMTLLQQNLFETPVGFRFLAELRDFIVNSNIVPEDQIPPLDTSAFVKTVVVEKEIPVQEPPKKEAAPKKKRASATKESGSYKTAFHVTLFFAIIFGLSVLGMFVIAELSDNNVNILNYREEIINEYEQWEVELKEKETQLRDWEEQLSEREEALKNAQ